MRSATPKPRRPSKASVHIAALPPPPSPLRAHWLFQKQQNLTVQLEPGLTTDVVKASDKVFMWMMERITSLLPNFRQFDDVDYVAHGFDIPPEVVLVQVFTALGYVAAVFAVGYFFLRTREVAR